MKPPPEAAPGPPGDLTTRIPLELTVAAGEVLHRFYTAALDPIYFDRGRDGRLNAPDGTYGVLYTAQAAQGAFAETFLRTPGLTQIPSDLLAKKAYTTLEVLRPLRFVRMAGPGLARLGATAQVVHGGKPYDVPQA
ncbi:RES domain-containing protein [Acidisphaera sp. S103]|uniref:RES domain-containing protein n=1 Tax=Acidisphaera sp. S103 TaxID=1747223 RepID=UPI0020B15918|nr:RES domain-containing protein [Acidisphaera sp. S103]